MERPDILSHIPPPLGLILFVVVVVVVVVVSFRFLCVRVDGWMGRWGNLVIF
jgi:hypothetical protein